MRKNERGRAYGTHAAGERCIQVSVVKSERKESTWKT
jgi:hypothetical protein